MTKLKEVITISGINELTTKAKDPTDAVFGMTPDGDVFHMPLSAGPQWLVAGTTGSGKSVFMNNLAISIMSHATPDELQIFAIDPKKVEFTPYTDLPYCPIPPINNMQDAYGFLLYMTWEMDHRYEALAQAGVKNLPEFNQWVKDHPDEAQNTDYPEGMKYQLLIIDEYADLSMTTDGAVSDPIIRIAQKARASGQHMIIATQRPSADIISPTIKANIPARIALKVADATNSMIILDDAGAEKLQGHGDALVKTADGSVTRMQGPYVSTPELERIFGYFKKEYPKPKFFDYKKIVVDNDMAQWAEDYDESVPWEDRHLKAKSAW